MDNIQLFCEILRRFDENLKNDKNDNSNITYGILKISEERLLESLKIMMHNGLILFSDGTRKDLTQTMYKMFIDRIRITPRGMMFLKENIIR